ncbi:uncharacterized protein LOC114828401 [Galendromus occidentalis]|uniref:Uncharacterized protein LOC114828401 n=1 Tax=Galendromus occidentalis TaxID=34638 RepID=A0AAJ7WII2_9ACAR|nr:uncharacterized protein LOC114828401 [Galendromus occidentalis]
MPSSLICDTFVENSWRRDLCSNCFRCEAEHEITMVRSTNPRLTTSSAKIDTTARDFRSDLHLSLLNSSKIFADTRSSNQVTTRPNPTVKSILKGGPLPNKKKGVAFKDEEQVIGFGGLDCVPEDGDDVEDDDWDVSEEDFDEALLDSLDTTEQDKMFTKLTKKNTDFNSINANLNKDTKNSQKGETKVDHSAKLSMPMNTELIRDDHRIDLDLTRSVTEELDKRLQLMRRNKKGAKDDFNYLDESCKDVLTAEDLSLTRDLLIGDAKGDSIDSGAPSSRESSSSPDSFSLKGSERGSSSPDSTRSSKSSAYESIYDTVENAKAQSNHISTVMVNNAMITSKNNSNNKKLDHENSRNDLNSSQPTEVTAISVGDRGLGRQPVRRASHRVVLRTDSDTVIASNNATTIQIEGQPRGNQLKTNAQNKVSSQTLKISEFALGSQGLQPARSDSNLLEAKTALKTASSSVPSFNAPMCRTAVSELHLDRFSQKNIPSNNGRQVKCLSAANIEQSYADQRSAEKYGTLRRTSRLYEDPKYLAFASRAKPVQPPVVPSIRKDIYGTYRAAKKYTAPKIPIELEQEPIYAEPIEHVAKPPQQSNNMDSERKSAQTENIYQEIRGSSTLSRKERQLAELALELEKARYNSVPNRRSAPVLSEYAGQWDPVSRQFQKPLPPGAPGGVPRKTRQAPAIPRAASTGGGSISRAGLFNLKKLLKRGNSNKDDDSKTWKAELQISQPRPIHRPEILHPSDLERLGESVIYQKPRMNTTKVERFGSILHGTSEAQFQPLMNVETAPPPPPMRQRVVRDSESELSRSASDVVRQQPKVPKRRLRLDYANMEFHSRVRFAEDLVKVFESLHFDSDDSYDDFDDFDDDFDDIEVESTESTDFETGGKSDEKDSTTSALQPLASNLWSSPAKLLESLQEINHQELVGLLNHVSTCSHGLPVPENNGSNQGSGTLTSASCNGGISWADLRITSEKVPKGEDLHICKAVYNSTNAKLTLLFTPPKSLPLANFLLERTVVASNGLQSGQTVLILPQSQVRTLQEFSSHCDERSALYIMLQLCRDLQSLQSQGVASLIPSEQQVLVASWDQLAYLLLMYKKSPKNSTASHFIAFHRFALSILSELQAPEKQNPILNLITDLLKRNDFDMCKRVIEFELWQAPRDPMANAVPGENVRDALNRWLALQKALTVQKNCSSQMRHSPSGHKQILPCSVFLEYQLQFLANATADSLAATLDVIKHLPEMPTLATEFSDPADNEELYADYRYC